MTVVVFSDLDGTLLDHETYSWEPARPAIDRLKALGIPVVLASSKTAAEISELHRDMDLGDTPAIVENGAGILMPGASQDTNLTDYARLRNALKKTPGDLRALFSGFGDMDDVGVADVTGLALPQAKLARKRQFTEPGIWRGSEDQLTAFIKALEDQGLSARYGGRFLTLSFGRTKAQAMSDVAKDLGATITIALGDAPNDREMIEAATYGVVIKNTVGKVLPSLIGEEEGHIRRTIEEGPKGWTTAICQILAEIELKRERETHG